MTTPTPATTTPAPTNSTQSLTIKRPTPTIAPYSLVVPGSPGEWHLVEDTHNMTTAIAVRERMLNRLKPKDRANTIIRVYDNRLEQFIMHPAIRENR